MKKKIFAVALAAAMTVTSAMSAFALETELDCTGWWTAHADGIEVTAEGVEFNFKNTTYAEVDATAHDGKVVNFDTPIVVIYNSTDGAIGKAGDAGYTEYVVIRSDLYAWSGTNNSNDNDSIADNQWNESGYAMEKIGVPADAAAWAEWLAANQKGVDCNVKATLNGKNVVVELTVNGVTSKTTVPVDPANKIYMSISGEHCKITNITQVNGTAAGTGTNTPAAGTGTNTPAAGTGTNTPATGTGTNAPAAGTGTNTPAAGTGTNAPAGNGNAGGATTGDVAPYAVAVLAVAAAAVVVVLQKKKVTE